MKMKKATAVALAAAVAVGTLGFAVPAKASELWNGTAGITAKLGAGNVFDSEKKLTVTAESENGWKLEAEGVTDTIGYNLAASGDTDSVYSADAPAASWNFTAEEITTEGTNKGMGIVVEDYTTKAAGNYTDTVTFTAKVEDASTPVTAITLNKTTATLYYLSSTVKVPETLSVTSVAPADATDKSVTWSSDNTNVATVDASTGKVTAVAAGTANITATANGGTNITAQCAVTVTDISADYSNMVECGCDDLTDKCIASNGDFSKKILDENVAIALAKGKAAETGSNCAVFYKLNGSRHSNVCFAKNDGTTGQARPVYTASEKGLSGYKGYYVNQ